MNSDVQSYIQPLFKRWSQADDRTTAPHSGQSHLCLENKAQGTICPTWGTAFKKEMRMSVNHYFYKINTVEIRSKYEVHL